MLMTAVSRHMMATFSVAPLLAGACAGALWGDQLGWSIGCALWSDLLGWSDGCARLGQDILADGFRVEAA